jgi:hypothetical protein
MWGLLPRKTQVLIIVGLAIVLPWTIEGATGLLTGNTPSELKLISLVVTITSSGIAAVGGAVWRKIWKRLPVMGRKLFPDLIGTWAGELTSTWKNPATGEAIAPIPVTIWIRQGAPRCRSLSSGARPLRDGPASFLHRVAWSAVLGKCRGAPATSPRPSSHHLRAGHERNKLRRRPRGRLRTDRGRRGLLLLHRSGLSPHTPCSLPAHSPAFRSSACADATSTAARVCP